MYDKEWSILSQKENDECKEIIKYLIENSSNFILFPFIYIDPNYQI